MKPMSAQGSIDGTTPTTSVVFFWCVLEGADHAALLDPGGDSTVEADEVRF